MNNDVNDPNDIIFVCPQCDTDAVRYYDDDSRYQRGQYMLSHHLLICEACERKNYESESEMRAAYILKQIAERSSNP